MAKRIDELDGIRALAISAVVIHHLFHVRLLWMGVDLFFVLSGFLITGVLLNYKDSSIGQYLGRFYARRARRILPPYLLLLLVTAICFGVWWLRSWSIFLFFVNLATVANAKLPFTLCVLWSLGVEEQFYFVWPFAVYFFSEEAIAWLAAALMLAAPLLRWFCTPLFPQQWFIYSLTPFRIDTLAAGSLLAILWRRRQAVIRRFGHFGPVISLAAAGVLALLARNPQFTTSANTRESNTWIYEMTLFIALGIILWALSGKGTWALTLAPVRYLGRISYTVYLIHLTIYFVAMHYLHGEVALALAVLPGTLLYATASWYLLERPLLFGRVRVRPVAPDRFSRASDHSPPTFVVLPNPAANEYAPSISARSGHASSTTNLLPRG